ncbi:hypothetical protein BCR44DRAFT_1461666 [Catenaria anguillulae PL171]|uniref:Secreted protein n=1 Tax=Catenaria anguillulae PL171 TaxID=765915 RepID=A0A1Y2HJS7_9FUNG|nr:hypothetical protein BCR44DRAFT_1461666 [Catenaria anguillulae PL171]
MSEAERAGFLASFLALLLVHRPNAGCHLQPPSSVAIEPVPPSPLAPCDWLITHARVASYHCTRRIPRYDNSTLIEANHDHICPSTVINTNSSRLDTPWSQTVLLR